MIHACDISLVIPLLNEKVLIPELVRRSSNALSSISARWELIVVDDGSSDGTLEAIKAERASEPRVRYISLSRNFGHQLAITAGLDAARGGAVVIMDGDLQDPPELIPELYAKHKEGFQVVYAKRRRREDESFWKKWSAAVFYRALRRITRIDIPLDTGDFRLISAKVLHRLGEMRERDRFLRGQIAWLGFRQTFVLYNRQGRAAGTGKYTVRKMIGLAMAGVLSFSSLPLRLATFFGFLVSFIAFCIILYALWSKHTQGDVISGWTSMIVSTMFIGGVQLICLGIIGEYVNRISQEVRQRPMYVVDERSEEPLSAG
jgi:glycosyltransferase involved in cell wall biosynthesis